MRVIDGDTFELRVRIWLAMTVIEPVRLAGVDTPETRGAQCASERARGQRATAFARTALDNARVIAIADVSRDKFGRLLADVLLYDAAGKQTRLAALLIRAGLARAYDGGKRRGWCAAE